MHSMPIPSDIDRSIQLASLARWAESNGYRLATRGGRLWLESRHGIPAKPQRPQAAGSARAE